MATFALNNIKKKFNLLPTEKVLLFRDVFGTR